MAPCQKKENTSPLVGCLATAKTTFNGFPLAPQQPFIRKVMELLREVIEILTCDRRNGKRYVSTNFAAYILGVDLPRRMSCGAHLSLIKEVH